MRDSNAERAGSMHQTLVELLGWLKRQDYVFTTVTPATHARVLERKRRAPAAGLRDIFGWSLPFTPDQLPPALLGSLSEARLVERQGDLLKSRLRVSTLHGRLFLHSAFPTDTNDAVFFGPDSYRFADFIATDLSRDPIQGDLLDIGAGSGVGAIVGASLVAARRMVLTDVNPAALALARANAAFAGRSAEFAQTPDARSVEGAFAVIVANPPFIDDPQALAYRHGGDLHGARMALQWTEQAIDKLAPGGRFLLYSGSAIVGGRDALKAGLEALVQGRSWSLAYRELDPDIFGEQLDESAYAEVERIAAIGARITRL
jgi:methylase of polypeptide subunit release factors